VVPVALLSLLPDSSPAQDWDISLSGHARTMYESYHGADFGFGPVDNDDWLHQRLQLLATLDRGDAIRLAAELTWGRMWGKVAPLAPPDQDDPDILQLYAQIAADCGEGDRLLLRAGRQTLYYGSGRLLAAREGANQRLAHDAVLLSWQRGEDTRVDAFVASPSQVEPGALDNESRPSELLLWSLYAVTPLPWGRDNHADFYYLGLRDEDSFFAPGGTETRHTVGARFWRDNGVWRHNSEFIAQWGDAGGRDILAGAASLGISRESKGLPWTPLWQFRGDLISGGDRGGTLHTFHPLFQANNYFNEGGFLSPSNLINLNPLVTLHPLPDLELSCGLNFQWLFSTRDSIYGPPLQQLATPRAGGSRYLGTAFNVSLEWQAAEHTTCFLAYTRHQAGAALTDVGGSNVDYLQASFRRDF
jgi:hypothetical protein